MNSIDVPPLTPAETREVLRRLGDLTNRIVLVGGQALAFWVEHYTDRIATSGPVSSRDIDFGGTKEAVTIAADRLDGTPRTPEPFSNTPNTGLVEFVDPGGHKRWIDFLGELYGEGLNLSAIEEMAVGVDVPDGGDVTTFLVMHPVHCLESRISNVGGLPQSYETPLAWNRRAHPSCVRVSICATG